jgi:glutaredoxin
MAGFLGAILLGCLALIARATLSKIGTVVQAEPTSRATDVAAASPSRLAAAEVVETVPPIAGTETPPPVEATPPLPPPNASGESIALPDPVPPPARPVAEAAPAPSSGAPSPLPGPSGGPSQVELLAAVRATPITMYATTWCGVCKRARQFLAENGLNYREIDPDVTPDGWASVRQLIGRQAVPVIVVDGVTTAGLSPQRVLDAVARSTERRLGMPSGKIRFVAQGTAP